MRSTRLVLGLAATLVLATSIARAQPHAFGEPASAGVAVAAGAVSGDAEATAVSLDAANLAFLPSWSVQYLHTQLAEDDVRGGRGDALFFGANTPLLPQLAWGAGLESIRPPLGFSYPAEAKLTLAFAWKLLPSLALGFGWAHIFGDDSKLTGGGATFDTIDLSLSGRLGPWIGLALVVHDVNAPTVNSVPLQRVYEPELLFRPLGDRRFELAFAARLGERRGDVSPRVRINVRPTSGLTLQAALELRNDLDIDGNGTIDRDWRATAGLILDLEHVGASSHVLFHSGPAGLGAQGFAVGARVSGDRKATLITPRHLERVDLAGGSDRDHVHLLRHLAALAQRPRTDGVVLVFGDLKGGWARMEELRSAIARLRAAGRHVYAYSAELNTKSYFVASAAEKVWLDPAGGIRLIGLASTATYFKGSFDLLGVQADFIKIAEYKSAPEQYTDTGPSERAKEQKAALYDDIYEHLVAGIASSRHMEAARVKELVDRGPYTAVEADRAHLVDGLKHGDEIEPAIGDLLGARVEVEPPETAPKEPASFAAPAIAVLHVEGDIVDGKSRTIPFLDEKLAGHESLLAAIGEARGDSRVKAILVRVDSPGGSALASDLVARELRRTRDVKPVVCSLGDVAASGGYFIASACDVIFAEPSTITGSIGIFTGKFDVSGLAGKLGVTLDGEKRGEHADEESMFRVYTDDERVELLGKLRYYYGRFVDAVAEGRRMKAEDVDAVGRGHVWTGSAAIDKKLVDTRGGFLDALAEAARRGGLDAHAVPEVIDYPEEPTTLLGQLAQLVGITAKSDQQLADLIGPALRTLARGIPASLWLEPSTPQARLDTSFDW